MTAATAGEWRLDCMWGWGRLSQPDADGQVFARALQQRMLIPTAFGRLRCMKVNYQLEFRVGVDCA